MKFETLAIHRGEEPNFKEGGTGDVVIPLHLSATFAREKTEIPTAGYEYSRSANPTRDALEERLASLESAKFGLAFSSGLAAETTLLVSLLKSGDHMIASDDLYGGSRRLFDKVFNKNFNIDVSFTDARLTENIEKLIRKNTKVIWIETPTNPLLKLCDIKLISEIAHKSAILLVVDNTFMSPYFQNPLKLGADVVLHSTTKYMNGHSDSVGGAVMLSNPEIYEKVKFMQNATGTMLSPFDSFLVLRGIKTLAVRMEAHEKNALKITGFLESRPEVLRVIYPGSRNHPQFALSKKQMKGFGGMISFEIEGGLNNAKIFAEALKYFSLAESLGGVESLVEIPAAMTHSSVPVEERKKIGLSEGLIRLSVGIENVDDLIDDIDNALKTIYK